MLELVAMGCGCPEVYSVFNPVEPDQKRQDSNGNDCYQYKKGSLDSIAMVISWYFLNSSSLHLQNKTRSAQQSTEKIIEITMTPWQTPCCYDTPDEFSLLLQGRHHAVATCHSQRGEWCSSSSSGAGWERFLGKLCSFSATLEIHSMICVAWKSILTHMLCVYIYIYIYIYICAKMWIQ